MEHSVLCLALLAIALLLFTVGANPSHSVDPSGEETYPDKNRNLSVHSVSKSKKSV